jgi:hypothetical protein
MRSNRWIVLPVALVLALFCFNTAHADKYDDTIGVFKKSDAVTPFFENCYGYAVFPTVGKGGIGIGGAYGSGQVYAQGVATGTVKLIKATIGFQAGGQAFSEMIFFEDKRAFEEFTSGNFEFDAGCICRGHYRRRSSQRRHRSERPQVPAPVRPQVLRSKRAIVRGWPCLCTPKGD